jgi:hypothetical protein
MFRQAQHDLARCRPEHVEGLRELENIFRPISKQVLEQCLISYTSCGSPFTFINLFEKPFFAINS